MDGCVAGGRGWAGGAEGGEGRRAAPGNAFPPPPPRAIIG